MNNIIKLLKFGLLVFALVFVFSPNIAWADGITQSNDSIYVAGQQYFEPMTYSSSATTTSAAKSTGNANIFEILRSKIYNTLKDVRKIVYVIAGFGLVMFAVFAIFNKVSYKHLGYIMISLCLLSLMFPFLEYFSGQGTIQSGDQTQMDFKNFLDTQYAVIQQTSDQELKNAMNGEGTGTGANCEGEECEETSGDEQLQALNQPPLPDEEEEEERVLSVADYEKAKSSGCDVGALYKSGSAKSAWGENGTRSNCSMDDSGNLTVTVEQCSGKLKEKKGKTECVKTAGQVWNDIKNGTMAAAGIIGGTVNTVSGAVSGVVGLANGAQNIGNAIQGFGDDKNFFDVMDSLGNLAGTTSNAVTSAAIGFGSVTSGLGNMSSGVGAIATIAATNPENNPTGENSVVTGASKFNQGLNNANQAVSGVATGVNGVIGEGNQVVTTIDSAVSYGHGVISGMSNLGK